LSKDSIPQIGNSEPVWDAVFELSMAQPVAKRLFFHQDKYYYVKLVGVFPSKSKPSEDKKPSPESAPALFKNAIMETWKASLEKQATIKISDSFKKSTGPRSASL